MKIEIKVDTGDDMCVQSFMQYTDKIIAIVDKLCSSKQESEKKELLEEIDELKKPL